MAGSAVAAATIAAVVVVAALGGFGSSPQPRPAAGGSRLTTTTAHRRGPAGAGGARTTTSTSTRPKAIAAPTSTTATTKSVTASYSCAGPEFKLFNNWSPVGVSNGGSAPSFSTRGKPYCLVAVATYHYNNGGGATPGTIALVRTSGPRGVGSSLPPTKVLASAGQADAPNVNWVVNIPDPTTTRLILDGTYQCVDSDPGTWSQSHGPGYCWVEVTAAAQA